MKSLLVALSLLLATPAFAADLTIKLNDTEQKQLIAILDSAAKCGGVQMAVPIALFIQKMQQAANPTPPDATKK